MMSPMKPSLTDTLCTRCALCCDGSLFADVELAGAAEAVVLESLGLEIDEDQAEGELLVLPCRALHGKRCGIYAQRPQCCRTFECRLLQDVRRGAVSVDRAKEHIAEARRRIAQVEELLSQWGRPDARLSLKERCAEVLAANSAIPDQSRKRRELGAAMSAVERLIRRTFLSA